MIALISPKSFDELLGTIQPKPIDVLPLATQPMIDYLRSRN
jgi:hypothetical protein